MKPGNREGPSTLVAADALHASNHDFVRSHAGAFERNSQLLPSLQTMGSVQSRPQRFAGHPVSHLLVPRLRADAGFGIPLAAAVLDRYNCHRAFWLIHLFAQRLPY